ncbi:3'(2'),5'-bisphosphate nucleotidase 1-like isoform X4 [Sinocyclocheilus rhinocerous]|uniref:3'(2'),5'-bisphosphate nucleotidase 1-like isoform X4 n=1 Tax=Sinocyclocheilus rhinocerous TaxID=307959 RepID=UPI0007B80769|nr:PREDICTED: 3'(2'),5'-bisphosphate nucleotidase 1-like isoform X4 [Sinocyclocheilus rhinocerous]
MTPSCPAVLSDRSPCREPLVKLNSGSPAGQTAIKKVCLSELQRGVLSVSAAVMASSPAVLMRLVASAYTVAEKAGTIVRKVLQSGELGIVEKLVVWVDPLDGTKEYTEAARVLYSPVYIQKAEQPYINRLLDHVTVLIGIAYGGTAIAGVINQPFYNYQMGAGASLGRTLWGVLGLGAFGFQLQEVPDGKRIVTTTRSHSNKLVIDAVQAMEPHDVIRVGGAGNKIIQLVEGKASAYVFASPGCKKWDTCAPEAILHAVGGKLTDMHGNAYRYDANVKHMNSAGVLATLRNHEYYLSRVPQVVLQALPSD